MCKQLCEIHAKTIVHLNVGEIVQILVYINHYSPPLQCIIVL